ncbi:MAG: hypothetical protein WBF48_10405 [Halarcobacter sp.]
MILVNINTIFTNAVYDRKIDVLEKILASSDSRIDLLEEFAEKEDLNLIIKVLPKFKSKGLILNIENNCNLILNRNSCKENKNKNFKPFIKKHIHYENIEKNKNNYLREVK